MATNKEQKQMIDNVNAHMRALKKQMYEIGCEVLENGTLPRKAHYTDAGFDVFATEDVVIKPGQVIKHPLNIKLHLPAGSWARIETKSGLGSKGMLVYAGVVDQEYRGIPHVIATNLNHHGDDIVVKKGQKLAQITMNPHSLDFYIKQVESVDTATERGEGGFGSTGSR